MFKAAIYFNIFFFLVMSIIFLVRVFSGGNDLKKIRRITYIYMLLNYVNAYVSGYTDIGWSWIGLLPIIILTFILNIICVICIRKKLKKEEQLDYNPMNIKVMILLIVLPIIIVALPFIREVYILYNCDYMIVYNYQEGWINSTDTNIAVYNNKPVTLSLELYMFERDGKKTNTTHCEAVYSDSGVVIQDHNVEDEALDVFKNNSNAKSADIYYFENGKYVIITLLADVGHGTVLGEYFYYDDTLVTSISTLGDLEKVICYK